MTGACLKFIGHLAVAAGALCLAGQLALAQAFPAKPVRLVAPFSGGGGADMVARLVGQKLSDLLAQQVIVDNRPGAGNVIGTEIVARAAPDGYTIMISIVNHSINAGLYRKLPYDSINDCSRSSATRSSSGTSSFRSIEKPDESCFARDSRRRRLIWLKRATPP